jgi:hypothetical protein
MELEMIRLTCKLWWTAIMLLSCKSVMPSDSEGLSTESVQRITEKLAFMKSFIPIIAETDELGGPTPATVYSKPRSSRPIGKLPATLPVKILSVADAGHEFVEIQTETKLASPTNQYFAKIADLRFSIRMYADKDVVVYGKESRRQIGKMRVESPVIIWSFVDGTSEFVQIEAVAPDVGSAFDESADRSGEIPLIKFSSLKPTYSGTKALPMIEIGSDKVTVPSAMNLAKEVILTMDVTLESYIADFYVELYKINRQVPEERKTELIVIKPQVLKSILLSGIVSPEHVTAADVARIEDLIRAKLALPDNQPIPLLRFVEAETTSHVWTQDTTEQLFIGTEQKPAMLNLHKFLDSPQVFTPILQSLQQGLNIPTVDFGHVPKSQEGWAFDEGGNIDGTPDGHFFIGQNLPWPLKNAIKAIDPKFIEVDVDFLEVSHIDLVFSIIPSHGTCGYSLLFNDPLILFQKILGGVPLPEGYLVYEAATIKKFLKPGAHAPYDIGKFDLDRTPRNLAEWHILENLRIHNRIAAGVKKIREGLDCAMPDKDIVALPQLFRSLDLEEVPAPGENIVLQPLSYHLNHANINGHYITSIWDEKEDAAFAQSIAGVVPADHIHFIRADNFTSQLGGVHCSSLVIRSPARL